LRLAEHPSVSVQLLVSGLLDHAAGQPERLRALAPYVVTVLSQVNRGKAAKQRVIDLLRREAARSAEAAAVIAPILDRQSATADLRFVPKDRSGYVAWRAQQSYIDTAQLISDQKRISEEMAQIQAELVPLETRGVHRRQTYHTAVQRYFRFLYERDKELWYKL